MPPKSSLRQRAATPAKSTRAASVLPQDTPGARRSTRNVSRQSLAPRDVISNPALPEIQTQQSYAYGSSKTPALPEQLQARDLSMRAIVNRLDDAAAEAERNLEAHVAEVRGGTPESQIAAREARAQRRASREASQQRSPPVAETPEESRKRDRTAAWIESSQLDDIEEEKSSQSSPDDEPETPVRNREASLPSSFPTGSFANHSYSYERGDRRPNFPEPEVTEKRASPERQQQTEPRAPRRTYTQTVKETYRKFTSRLHSVLQNMFAALQNLMNTIQAWTSRMVTAFRKSLQELPDSPLMSVLFKTIFTVAVLSLLSFAFCSVWTRFCNSESTSIVSRSLQQICGSCTTSFPTITSWNITGADSTDLSQLIAALQKTQTQIAQIEARLNSRIDSSRASQSSEISALRAHQDALEAQIRQLNEHHPSLDSGSDATSNNIPSPLISQINFFSPSNDAIVLPHLTSPTLSRNPSSYLFPIRVALNMIGLRQRIGAPPVAALEPWIEEGDRWCAAPPEHMTSNKAGSEIIDHLRLGIQTRQSIYPTELVIEHFPSLGSLEPEITPKDIELWADFSTLSHDEWMKLHIADLITESPREDDTFLAWLATRSTLINTKITKQTWARIGVATYHTEIPTDRSQIHDDETYYEAQEVSADQAYMGIRQRSNSLGNKASARKGQETNHVQRFNLLINQNGLLHYSSRFLVRVKSNYGGAYTCLYRVRLHGLPVATNTGEREARLNA